MRIKLVVVGGEVKPSEFAVTLPIVIGRGKEASFPLLHRLVSRAHCKIYEEGGKTIVEDLQSLNGTFVNNRRIQEPTPLAFGQLLTIGDVTFRVMQDAGAAKAAAPSETSGPEETEATVHAPTARPAMPDFTVAVEGEVPAGELVEESTEASPAVTPEIAAPQPVAPGVPNLPKFPPRRPRF